MEKNKGYCEGCQMEQCSLHCQGLESKTTTEPPERRAILIVGGQGAGKTTKAVELAKSIGTYVSINYATLSNHFQLATVLVQQPDVVIIEEVPLGVLDSPDMKRLISESEIQVERKGKDPEMVKTPTLILTHQLDRRFEIVAL